MQSLETDTGMKCAPYLRTVSPCYLRMKFRIRHEQTTPESFSSVCIVE